jgi:putative phage-type endonuclease
MVLTDSDSETNESEYVAPFFVRVSDECLSEMETQAKEYITEYLRENILRFSSPTFITTLVQDIAGVLLEEWKLIELCDDEDYSDIVDFVEQIHAETTTLPPRQEATTDETSYTEVGHILRRIREIPQAKQRSPEWYETRHNLLTASNLWKVFGTPAQYNSLVYEKCLSIETIRSEKKTMSIDSNSPLQMGVKYEPVSIMLYEKIYGTRVSDVGCIPHAQYPFIGASPDGINMTPGLPRYGRMIEVKNIVNREITGVPLEHYWIQMQLQMEACDLEECDFIETRFKEINETNTLFDVIKTMSEDDPTNTLEDGSMSQEGTTQQEGTTPPAGTTQHAGMIQPDGTVKIPKGTPPMGCILYFLPRVNADLDIVPEYAYMPLDIEVYSYAENEWVNQQRTAHPYHILFRQTYWVLDQFSFVLVRRNREWFRAALPRIEEAWNTIVQERETGCDHRVSAKKKKLQTEVVCSDGTTTHYIKNMPFSSNICLVKLDAEDSYSNSPV